MESKAPESPLMVFRIIACSMTVTLVGLTVIIYVTSGMFHRDCIAQICSEISLLAAHTSMLLITTDIKLEESFCTGIAVFLHFIEMASLMFMMLEVVCMARSLFECFPKYILSTRMSILIIGWSVPATIAGVSAIIMHDQYTSKYNCWLDLSKKPMWVTVIPVGIIVVLQFLLLFAVLMVSKVPHRLPQYEYDRAKCFLTTRWASLIITATAVVSYGCGLMAAHTNDEMYFAATCVATIVLGVLILTLRISTDDEIRGALMAHVLCYFSKTPKKISAWQDKVLISKNIVRFTRSPPPPLNNINNNAFEKPRDQTTLTNHVNHR